MHIGNSNINHEIPFLILVEQKRITVVQIEKKNMNNLLRWIYDINLVEEDDWRKTFALYNLHTEELDIMP